jgi:hypothetical protein
MRLGPMKCRFEEMLSPLVYFLSEMGAGINDAPPTGENRLMVKGANLV